MARISPEQAKSPAEEEYPFYSDSELEQKMKEEKGKIERGEIVDPLAVAESELVAADKLETSNELDPKKGYAFGTPGWNSINEGMRRAYDDTRTLDMEESGKDDEASAETE